MSPPIRAASEKSPLPDPVTIALEEDLGPGGNASADLTSRYFVGRQRGHARIFAKERAVTAGVEVAAEVFRRIDSKLSVAVVRASGQSVRSGQTVLEVKGALRSILTAERVALNFLQRLSGVATLTRRFVDAVEGYRARILDTRKTTPGLRALEKAAVVAGGGCNHRLGLYDMVMLKDNHHAARGDLAGLQRAIDRFRRAQPGCRVEIEADTLGQVRAFLHLRGVDVILLDNMSLRAMTAAVLASAGRVLLEASGGVNLDSARSIAATGVDFISIGALTHSAPAIDFSLEVQR